MPPNEVKRIVEETMGERYEDWQEADEATLVTRVTTTAYALIDSLRCSFEFDAHPHAAE